MNKEEHDRLEEIYKLFQGFLDGIDPIGSSGGEDQHATMEIGQKFESLLQNTVPMNKKEIIEKYFLKGYKYAVERLTIEPDRDILVELHNEYLDKNDIAVRSENDSVRCGICGCTTFYTYRSELTDNIYCNNCNAYCSFVESNVQEKWNKKGD